mmetsp:Transcript_3392/g.4272  ORF Transcript_3392/g.4272 Transcript_3392/m.4272 type:complete len:278 (-) Transcript_3392:282-1115(-)
MSFSCNRTHLIFATRSFCSRTSFSAVKDFTRTSSFFIFSSIFRVSANSVNFSCSSNEPLCLNEISSSCISFPASQDSLYRACNWNSCSVLVNIAFLNFSVSQDFSSASLRAEFAFSRLISDVLLAALASLRIKFSFSCACKDSFLYVFASCSSWTCDSCICLIFVSNILLCSEVFNSFTLDDCCKYCASFNFTTRLAFSFSSCKVSSIVALNFFCNISAWDRKLAIFAKLLSEFPRIFSLTISKLFIFSSNLPFSRSTIAQRSLITSTICLLSSLST